MADVLMRSGRDRDALAFIARLLGEVSDPKVGIFVSELWRIRGELLARGGWGRYGACGKFLAGGVTNLTRAGGDAASVPGGYRTGDAFCRAWSFGGSKDGPCTIRRECSC